MFERFFIIIIFDLTWDLASFQTFFFCPNFLSFSVFLNSYLCTKFSVLSYAFCV